MATRLVQSENNGRRVFVETSDNRRLGEVNGRLGWFTPAEHEQEAERRRTDPNLAPVFADDEDDDYR